MAPGNFVIDTTTKWQGVYDVEVFQIRASGPLEGDIYTRTRFFQETIKPANPQVADGSYIITYEGFQSFTIALAYVSCDGTRSLSGTNIDDRTSIYYTARKIQDLNVHGFDHMTQEVGPSSPDNNAFISIGKSVRHYE